MKIVLPVHHYPPHYTAGAELYTQRLARQLSASGHTVEVIAIEAIDQDGRHKLLVDASHDGDVLVWRLRLNQARASDRMRWSYDHPLLRAWLETYLDRSTPDLMHAQGGYLIGVAPIETAHARGVPCVLTLHDFWFLCPRITLQRGDGSVCNAIPDNPAGCAWCQRLESRRYRLPEQWSGGRVGPVVQKAFAGDAITRRRARLQAALRLPAAVIAPSHFLAAQFAPYVAPERLHVLRYGLEQTPRSVSQPRSQRLLRIGYTGQIAPHKGVHVLVEAVRQLNVPVALHLHGGLDAQPAYVERLQRMAARDPRIHFHGRYDHSQLATILGSLDVVVVPSVWYENSPLAIMEAQAYGKPVLTSALGGMAELVRDEIDGLLFRAGDAGDLARQFHRLATDTALRARLAANVPTPASIVDELAILTQLYDHVVASRPAVPSYGTDPLLAV